MGINVKEYDSTFHFDITGVSYIGNPKPNTSIYVSKKLESLLFNLERVDQCLIFVESGTNIKEEYRRDNAVIVTDNPQLEFAKFSLKLQKARFDEESKCGISLCDGGYYKSNDAVIGEGAYIEPGCFIGFGTVIGDNAVILAGSSIRYSDIGNNFLANEHTVIGTNAFTMATDEYGNKMRIYSMGKTVIGNDVEVGSHSNISRGSVGCTVIEDYVKLDSYVHIGHDAHIKKNVEIAAGATIGGFVDIGRNTFVGLNATLKNRITVGENDIIGMGASVMRSFPGNITLARNPAKGISRMGGATELKGEI